MISWIKLLTGVVGVFVVFNIFALKSRLVHQLYKSSHIKDRWMSFRMKVYELLLVIVPQRVFRRGGCFKKEYVVSKSFEEVDKRLSIENILRVT